MLVLRIGTKPPAVHGAAQLTRHARRLGRALGICAAALIAGCAQPYTTSESFHGAADAAGLELAFADATPGSAANCQIADGIEFCAFRFADASLTNWIVLRASAEGEHLYAVTPIAEFREATSLESLMAVSLMPEGAKVTDEDRAEIEALGGRFEEGAKLHGFNFASRRALESALTRDITTFVRITRIENRTARCAAARSSYLGITEPRLVGCTRAELGLPDLPPAAG